MLQAETAQKTACEKFDQMSDKGKEGKISHLNITFGTVLVSMQKLFKFVCSK